MHTLLKLIVLLLLILWVFGCSDTSAAETEAEAPRQVKIETVQPMEYREKVFATGRLSTREEVRLSFKTGGLIRQVHVREGQTVRAGQLLAELELDEIQANVRKASLGKEKATIDLNNAKLALRLAERDYENALGLYQDSVATLEQLQNAEVQLDNARNQLKAAQTGLQFSEQDNKVADFNLKHSKITAPSNGTILRQLAETNEIVGPGMPVFLFGGQSKTLVIKVNIPDKDIVFVALGDSAQLRFDAYPGQVFRGKVLELSSMADPYTGTYEVEVAVESAGQRLLSGFVGQVHIFTNNKKQLYRINANALVSGDTRQAKVFIVKDGKAEARTLTVYKVESEALLIKEGLQPGEQIVVGGAAYLESGSAVQVQ